MGRRRGGASMVDAEWEREFRRILVKELGFKRVTGLLAEGGRPELSETFERVWIK